MKDKIYIATDKYNMYIPNTSSYQKSDSDKLIQKFGYTKDEYEIVTIDEKEYLELVDSLSSFSIQ